MTFPRFRGLKKSGSFKYQTAEIFPQVPQVDETKHELLSLGSWLIFRNSWDFSRERLSEGFF